MNDINNKIEQAISEHLPEQTAKQMKEFIYDAERNKKKLETCLKTVETQDNSIVELNKEIVELKAANAKALKTIKDNSELVQRADKCIEDCMKRSNKMECDMLKFQNQTLCETLRTTQEFMINMSRSPVFKKTITDTKENWIPGTPAEYNENGYTIKDQTFAELKTETSTHEEISEVE